ncbi:MAG: hypothetical protein H7A44_13410 [Opitutaceae bacterium]|nr:hypothetical protein [Cephaloticoccus sp.]MCP5531423.1 hypothetical protein [Opitutaceae bacterium]
MLRQWLWILFLLGASLLPAEDADNIARIHVEAIGGKMRLSLLQSLQAEGQVFIDERRLDFTLVAQRPNRLRMETRSGERRIVQATDGVNPPWQMFVGANPGKPTNLTGNEAREFAADAEFDDPLVDYAAKGYTLDYAGKVDWNGKQVFRLFVTRRFIAGYYLLIDTETYFIVGKQAVRKLEFGREVSIETRYEDFRPVAGIIMPHRVIVTGEGRPLHETVMRRVQANVPVPDGIFAKPEPDAGD